MLVAEENYAFRLCIVLKQNSSWIMRGMVNDGERLFQQFLIEIFQTLISAKLIKLVLNTNVQRL